MYVIIGANGYLGSYILKAVKEKTKERILATARDLTRINEEQGVEWIDLDVQSDSSVDSFIERIQKEENVKVVYLAAYHHPDLVEKNRELAWDINITCLSKLINRMSFAKKIFYASTDCVYGESEDFYHFKENDALKPVNFYGHNKCAAEAVVTHHGYNVVRFPFLISPSLVYKPHFYDVIVNTIRNGEPFEMFQDSYRSSLSFENAGRLLIDLMEKEEVPQIVNVCGDRDLSKYDVGKMIAEREGLNSDLIVGISIETPKENFLTKRAASTLMSNELLKEILDLEYVDIFDYPRRKTC